MTSPIAAPAGRRRVRRDDRDQRDQDRLSDQRAAEIDVEEEARRRARGSSNGRAAARRRSRTGEAALGRARADPTPAAGPPHRRAPSGAPRRRACPSGSGARNAATTSSPTVATPARFVERPGHREAHAVACTGIGEPGDRGLGSTVTGPETQHHHRDTEADRDAASRRPARSDHVRSMTGGLGCGRHDVLAPPARPRHTTTAATATAHQHADSDDQASRIPLVTVLGGFVKAERRTSGR